MATWGPLPSLCVLGMLYTITRYRDTTEKEIGYHGKTPSYKCCNESILPGFQVAGISHRLEVHDPHRHRRRRPRPRRPSWHPLVPARHRELHDSATGHIRGRPQPAAVRLDNPAADRQPQAQPVRLGRIEGVEQPVELLRVQARPGITHGD